MDQRRRRIVYYIGGFVVLLLFSTLVYMGLMATFENEPRSFMDALEIVVQTVTGTGYGEDAAYWTTVPMQVFMILLQFAGVVFIFMALPLFLVPWMEERLSTSAPTTVEDLANHVVICSYTSRSKTLIDELEALDREYVVIEPDRDEAANLYENDVTVIQGDPESPEVLRNANLTAAQALVTDVNDETNASIVLAAGQVADDTQVITFVENPDLADYHRYAGADHVYSPRTLIGESLANKVTTSIRAEVGDAVEIGEDFEIAELPVQAGSRLAGVKVQDSGIREATGANIIGAWFRGEFVSPPSPENRIDEQTVLLVAGRESQLEQLKQLTLSEGRTRSRGDVIIGGYGEVGSTIRESLADQRVNTVTIDRKDMAKVDVVGSIADEETLQQARIEEASTAILTLADDTMTVFATLVIRELNPDIEIIARADQTESVQKIYRAGADYVLALATVSGRMLASTILDQEVLTLDQQIEIVRMDADPFAGLTLAEADIRARTGCTVIAIERNGHVITDLDPDVEFEAADDMVIAGPDAGVNELASIT